MRTDKIKKIKNIIYIILAVFAFSISISSICILSDAFEYKHYKEKIKEKEIYVVMDGDYFYNQFILNNKTVKKTYNYLVFTDSEERLFILNLNNHRDIKIIDQKNYPNSIIYLLFASYKDDIRYSDLISTYIRSYSESNKQIYIQ